MRSSEVREARAASAFEVPELARIGESWEMAAASPDVALGPDSLEELTWITADIPGTAARALVDAGRWRSGEPYDFDAEDWWFRTRFWAAPRGPDEEVLLRLGGVATVAQIFLNGECVLESESMFAEHAVDVSRLLRTDNELTIHCRALRPLLRERRRPRARWRTGVVSEPNLRFFRTTLLGRAPGFAPGPAPVGPYRPVLIERRRGLAIEDLSLRPHLDGEDGVLSVRARLRPLGARTLRSVQAELQGPSGEHECRLELDAGRGLTVARGELRVPDVARWWPHTHGNPVLHDVRLRVTSNTEELLLPAGRVGFRLLTAGASPDHQLQRDGLDLHVNDVRTFVRGAVWTPIDPVGLAPTREELRASLEAARNAGLNMLRLPGTGIYEEPAFYELCDELGLLVWQDLMYANLDYPFADDGFAASAEREARQVLGGLARHPSLAVVCGNSEVEQQVAMLGLDPALGRGDFFGTILPQIAEEAGVDCPYLPSSPCGGQLPFRTDRGVAHYFGVGAYLRPLEDVRRADVRFASECLAFSNVPDQPVDIPVHDPRWKAGVPRDAGAGWDFEDVRDHYLQHVYGIDPARLRYADHRRYLELSRAVTGDVMAEVFGEWRRSGSPCGGGIVLWLRDLVPGAGWGLFDSEGRPKLALRHLARALAPVAVWTSDEGLNGVVAHVANDRPEPLTATLRVALYRDQERRIDEASQDLELPGHSSCERNVEELLGRFADVSLAYRFGPAQHGAVVVSLERGGELLSQAVRFPAGPPIAEEPPDRIGLEARGQIAADGRLLVSMRSRRLAWGVRLRAPGFDPDDDGFTLEPGRERCVSLLPRKGRTEPVLVDVTALNLLGPIRAALEDVR